MGQEINLLDKYPRSNRPIEDRGRLITEDHRAVAREFAEQYFDGERLYGYGGYNYHPRFWQETVKRFCDHYQLADDASILDVGCAKGYMLHDFKELMPNLTVAGLDISDYALERAVETVKPNLRQGNAKELPYDDNSFDLVISINTIHNLSIDDCKQSLREIQRVTRKNAFITVDAFKNEAERESLLKWNLTALSYMSVDAWVALFDEVGYNGDYFWFIAV